MGERTNRFELEAMQRGSGWQAELSAPVPDPQKRGQKGHSLFAFLSLCGLVDKTLVIWRADGRGENRKVGVASPER